MDFEADYVVVLSIVFPKDRLLVCFEDVADGLLAESVLKSKESGLYWKVECRYVESSEMGFEAETVEPMLVNRGLREKPDRKYFHYRLQPIGHSEKPKAREKLKLHKTSCSKQCLILEVYDKFVLVDKGDNQTGLLPRQKFQANRQDIRPGDYARHCEHGYHDLVTENGEFIWRTNNTTK
jgi:hypothetical protein